MPGITALGSVVASGAGYATLALDPPPAVLQRPQPASYDRHRASYCAESTRFWNGTFETEGEPQNIFSHECRVALQKLDAWDYHTRFRGGQWRWLRVTRF